MDEQVGARLRSVRLPVSVAPVQPQVGMTALACEQADGQHLRRQEIFGGQQQPGTDPLALAVGGNHQPDEFGGLATDVGAYAGDEPACLADAPAMAAPLAEFSMQVRKGLGQRRDVKIPVSPGLGHERCPLQRQDLTGVTGCERRERSRPIHALLLVKSSRDLEESSMRAMGTGAGDRPDHRGTPAMSNPARWKAGDRQPRYLRIHSSLRERITTGHWPPGSPLPSQRELAAEFGVSIMTLRQALQLLTDEGLIETRHGSGTFAAAHYAYDPGHLRSFADDLTAQGAEITTTLLAAGTITPSADIGARLGAPGHVIRLRRLRLSGGRPLIVQTSYLPAALAPVVQHQDLSRRGLYTILAEHGQPVTHASETITPTTLSPADARDLARPPASPALLSHRISFTATGAPIIDDHALLPGDSVAVTANRTPHHLEVHYTLAVSLD